LCRYSKALFTPGSEFAEMMKTNPIVTTPMTSNTFEVRLVVNEDGAEEEGMVAGVYSHGVPDFAQWLTLFTAAQADFPMADMGIVKSYAGELSKDSGWVNDAAPASAVVMHIFKVGGGGGAVQLNAVDL
jgi:hypothetical protein